jgi:hypothetical protein
MGVYDKTTWLDNEAPDIDAVHLNKLEQGVADAHTEIATVQGNVAGIASALSVAQTDIVQLKTTGGGGGVGVNSGFTKNAIARGCKANDPNFNNGAILQTLLDEIRDAGHGELYLPGKRGDVYYMHGLWVPSNCRIISDGGVILDRKFGNSFDGLGRQEPNGIRVHGAGWIPGTIDQNLRIASDGLFVAAQSDLGFYDIPHDVKFEGLTLRGGTVVVYGVDGFFCEDFHTANDGFGIALGGGQGDQVGYANSRNCVFRDCSFKNHHRNALEFGNCRDVLIENCLIDGVDGVWNGEQCPGCGVESEQEGTDQECYNLRVVNCTIKNTAGAAVGLVNIGNGGVPVSADKILIQGNTFDTVSTKAIGAPPGVGTDGAIFMRGGQTDGLAVVRIADNYARAVGRAGFLSASQGPYDHGQVLATGNVCVGAVTGVAGTFSSLTKFGNIGV